MSTEIPVLDKEAVSIFSQEDADRIYDELRTMHVDLDADPLIFGPKRLNNKVSEVHRHLDRCQRIFLDVSQKLHTVKRQSRIVTAVLEMGKKYLYANDPETRSGRSVADREAIAMGKLRDEVQKVHVLELAVQDLESILVVVKSRRSGLRDTQNRLKEQRDLCSEEIGLGARWGSAIPNAPEINPGKVVAVPTMRDINEIFDGIDGEIHLPDGTEVEETNTLSVPVSDTEWTKDLTPSDIPDVLKTAQQRDNSFQGLETSFKDPQVLPPSATHAAVEAFLDFEVCPPPVESALASEKSFDSFLDGFEKP